MNKNPSFLWALATGLAFLVLQIVIFLIRFGSLNTGVPVTDYIFFFIDGALIGLALVVALRRCETKGAYRATMAGFVIGIPFALFGLVVGGLLGPVGSTLFSVSPGLFFIFAGYLVGRAAFNA